MAQAESIAMLDKELDVQAVLIEKLFDLTSYLEERVLQLEQRKGTSRSKRKKEEGAPHPPYPS